MGRKKLEEPRFGVMVETDNVRLFDTEEDFRHYAEGRLVDGGDVEVPFVVVRVLKRGVAVKPQMKLKVEKKNGN